MRLLLAFVCFFPVVLTAAESPVLQLAHNLNAYTSYQAQFKQITLSDNGEQLQNSNGVFSLERPGRLYWQVISPQPETIVVNHKTLWRYDPALSQATRQTLSGNQLMANPALLLSSRVDDVLKQFNVSVAVLDGKSWFKLTPHASSPVQFKSLYMQFQHRQLTSLIVINALCERSLFHFSHVRINQSIPAKQFQFTPPKGVDVDVQ